jgi:thioredoxin-related protein
MRNFISSLALIIFAIPAHAEMALVMVEEQGCMWCARWSAEIAPIYPKTTEGKSAPLRRMDVKAPPPDDLTFKTAPHYTPTFILVDNGQEIARIEGYPGEDFFWGLLGVMLKQAQESRLTKG